MKDELKFEEAMTRLEEIVTSLERGDAELDKILNLFEEGVKLARFCNKKLDEAEAKIQIMIKEDQIEPFEVSS